MADNISHWRTLTKKNTAEHWFQKFHNRDKSPEDKCCRRPAVINDGQLRAIIEVDMHKITWEVAEELNVDHPTIDISTKMEKSKSLTNECHIKNICCCYKIWSGLPLHNKNYPFFNSIVICN